MTIMVKIMQKILVFPQKLVALVFLCVVLLAPSAQADNWTCQELLGYDTLSGDERQWFQNNCAGAQSRVDGQAEDGIEQGYRPPDVTCPHLPSRVVVYGYIKNTQCQMVGEVALGKTSLIQRGFIDGVDVWNIVPDNVEVCFRNEGWLAFLDAAYASRAVMELEHYQREGMTCGAIDRPGTVVLLQDNEAAGDASDIPPVAAETGPTSSTICQLTTTDYLSLRGGPSINYARIEIMPPGARLLGMARVGDWFLVEYEEQRGWASGTYLTASPGCDALGESSRVFLPLATEPAPVEEETEEMTEPAQAETTMPGARPLSYCSLRAGAIINQRQGPGLEYDIIAEIPNRTSLTATERTRDWFKVEYNGEMGWIHIDYVFRHGCG